MDWKLDLRNGAVLPAADFLASVEPEEDDESELALARPKPKPKQCHVYLKSFSSESAKVNTFDQPPVYAIIGRGFAATVDRCTLQTELGRARVDGLKVVHVGYPDPWLKYVSHNMNQEVELLTLPGYKAQQSLDTVPRQPAARWLNSRNFAAHTATERSAIEMHETVFEAGVTHIEKRSEHYLVHLNDGSPPIIAAKIDLCTGTGQQTLLKTRTQDAGYGVDMTAELWEAYLHPDVASDVQGRRVYAAELYVLDHVRPIAGGLICVVGASPAGIQAMEHALCEDGGVGGGPVAQGLLVASRTMNEGFPAIGRLDDHAKDAAGDPLPIRQGLAKGDLHPTRLPVTFAEGYKIASIEPIVADHIALFEAGQVTEGDVGTRLLVTFRKNGGKQRLVGTTLGVDHGELLYGKFDQVVLGSGRTRGRGDSKEVGSALGLVWDFRNDLVGLPNPDSIDFPPGLQTRDGKVRILGAAGINNPIYLGLPQLARNELGLSPLGMYERSLPAQARVNGEGVTLAAATIAWANGYYTAALLGTSFKDGGVYPNANVASLPELESRFDKGLAEDIYYARHERVGPFSARNQLAHIVEFFRFKREVDNLGTKPVDIRGRLQAYEQKIAAARRSRANVDHEKTMAETLWLRQLIFAGHLNDDAWLFRHHDDWSRFNESWLGDVYVPEDWDAMDAPRNIMQELVFRPNTFFNYENKRMLVGDGVPPYHTKYP